jgi:hypothetical protein
MSIVQAIQDRHDATTTARAAAVAESPARADDTGAGSPAAPSGTSLLTEIRQCESFDEILEIVADEAEDLVPEECAVALYRLAYFTKHMSREGPQRRNHHNVAYSTRSQVHAAFI